MTNNSKNQTAISPNLENGSYSITIPNNILNVERQDVIQNSPYKCYMEKLYRDFDDIRTAVARKQVDSSLNPNTYIAIHRLLENGDSIELILTKMTLGNDSVDSRLATLENLIDGKPVSTKLKGGKARVFIVANRESDHPILDGFILNDVDNDAYNSWKKVHDGLITGINGIVIPVAPIISESGSIGISTEPSRKIVKSKVCGIPVDVLSNIYFEKLAEIDRKRYSPNGLTKDDKILADFWEYLHTTMDDTRKILLEKDIDHPHPHSGNFTVGFHNTEDLQRQLQQGATVNTITYSSSTFTCNPEEYFDNPEKWTPIVRIIDWAE